MTLIRVVDIRPGWITRYPRINPESGEFATHGVEYAIYELLEWMQSDPGFTSTSDRIRVWYLREGLDAVLYGVKGDGDFSESRINAESLTLIYDGSVDRLVDTAAMIQERVL